jgi:hypothetical protein
MSDVLQNIPSRNYWQMHNYNFYLEHSYIGKCILTWRPEAIMITFLKRTSLSAEYNVQYKLLIILKQTENCLQYTLQWSAPIHSFKNLKNIYDLTSFFTGSQVGYRKVPLFSPYQGTHRILQSFCAYSFLTYLIIHLLRFVSFFFCL